MDDLRQQAEEVGIDFDKALKGLERLLPVIATIAKLTPNPFDDMAVALLRELLANAKK